MRHLRAVLAASRVPASLIAVRSQDDQLLSSLPTIQTQRSSSWQGARPRRSNQLLNLKASLRRTRSSRRQWLYSE